MIEKNTKKIVRLVKCPVCGKAFYIKTKSKGKFNLKCPYCQNDVVININGDINIYKEDDFKDKL